MLVLSRKAGERIQIGEDSFVTVVRIGPTSIRIGIEAPREMNIVRAELTDGQADESLERLTIGGVQDRCDTKVTGLK